MSEFEFDVDLESIENEILEETEEIEDATQDEETLPEEGEDEQTETETETETEKETEKETTPPVETEEQKRNRAFAELRRRAEANEKYASVIQKIAEQAGTTPEEVVRRYEERMLEEQARQENVPVDVLKRLQALEQENAMIKEQTAAQRLTEQIEKIQKTFNASEDDIRNTFAYMMESGVDPRNNPNVNFEAFYKAANFDKLLEQKQKEAEQSLLSKKKERQQKAVASTHDGSAAQSEDDLDAMIDKEVASLIENW